MDGKMSESKDGRRTFDDDERGGDNGRDCVGGAALVQAMILLAEIHYGEVICGGSGCLWYR